MSSAANGRVRVSLPSAGPVGRLLGLGFLIAGASPLHAEDLERSPSSLAECDLRADKARAAGSLDTCFFELGLSWPRGFGPVHDHLMRRLRDHPGDAGARLWAGIFAHKEGQTVEAE